MDNKSVESTFKISQSTFLHDDALTLRTDKRSDVGAKDVNKQIIMIQ